MQATRRALLAMPALSTLGLAAEGSGYPSRPVRMIVPFPPGQAADVFARLVADQLSQRWPQRVVVENRAGGAGSIGMEAAARATPDGYTLGIGTSGTLGVNPGVMARLPYDAARDFMAITNIFLVPLVVITHPSFAPRSMAELVAHIRANPGQPFASAGPATAQHMTGEMFAHQAGLTMSHVPYRGSGPAIADLIAGNVQLMFDSTASAMPHIQSGRVRALGITTAYRMAALPDIPTLAETVLPGFAAAGWSGIVAPSGTPAAIIARINRDVVAILREPAVVQRITALASIPDPTTPEEFAAFIQSEITKWGEVARLAGVRLEG
ncbi:Bug family tripartite tricarboxylate transporter substrate binding protein [Rhodovarius sp.]|uniref:Bug family tripartite tricarboxylate transporter substrate binding protein n=1 Tax=Rhodovarius sp. TaxID=2972673 RepID=UPI0034A4C7F2